MDKKYLEIIDENKPGVLAKIARLLGDAEINIKDINSFGMGDKGVVRVITSDQEKSLQLLKNNGYQVEVEDGLILRLDDRSGVLAEAAEQLAEQGINIVSANVVNKSDKWYYLSIIVEKAERERARDTLKEYLL